MDFGKRGYFSQCKKYWINPTWMLGKEGIFHKVCHAKVLTNSPAMDFQWECTYWTYIHSFINIIFSMIFRKRGIVSGQKSPWFRGKRGVKMSEVPMERGVIWVRGIEHGYPFPYEVGVPGCLPTTSHWKQIQCAIMVTQGWSTLITGWSCLVSPFVKPCPAIVPKIIKWELFKLS